MNNGVDVRLWGRRLARSSIPCIFGMLLLPLLPLGLRVIPEVGLFVVVALGWRKILPFGVR